MDGILSLNELFAQSIIAAARVLIGLLVFLSFWVLSAIGYRMVRRFGARGRLKPDVRELLEQTVRIVLLLIGAVTALGTAGIDVLALVAGLGLTGFAIGFALRDAISNFLAGVLILVYEPFARGDHIAVSGQKGLVREINLRYTVLDGEGERILVPNAQLFSHVVVVAEEKTLST